MEKTYSALLIATEYLRSADAQIRRNAVTALAALPSLEAIREVVRTALGDPDVTVRERAEEEIASGAQPGAVNTVVAAELQTPTAALAAFQLVGRLRARGADVILPRMSLMRRLRLALATRRREPVIASIARPALVGGSVVAVGLLFYLAATLKVNLGSPGTVGVLFAALLGPAATMVISRRLWRPVQEQADRLSAVALEVVLLACLGAVTGAATLLVFLAFTEKPIQESRPLVALVIGACAFAGARCGTILAHGVARSALMNRCMQGVVGTVSGTLLMTAAVLAVRASSDAATSAVWTAMIPIVAGVSLTLTWIDSQVYLRRPAQTILGRAGRLCSIAIGAIAIVGLIATLISIRQASSQVVAAVSDTDGSRRIVTDGSPRAIAISIAQPTIALFSVSEEAEQKGDFKLGLWSGPPPTDREIVTRKLEERSAPMDFADDPPRIEEYLTPGQYHVIVGGYTRMGSDALRLSDVLPALRDRLLRRSDGLSTQCAMDISFRKATPEDLRQAAERRAATGDSVYMASSYRAIVAYSDALALDPNLVRAYVSRSFAYSEIGLFDAAFKDATIATGLNPDSGAWRALGRGLEGLNRTKEAIEAYDKAIEVGPSYVVHVERGNALTSLRKYTEAIGDFSRALALTTDGRREGYDALVGRGIAYMRRGSAEEAWRDFEAALAISSLLPNVYTVRAWLYNARSAPEEAIREANNALKRAPAYSSALKNRGRAHYLKKDYKSALADLDMAIALASARPRTLSLAEAYRYRADVWEMLNERAKADEDLARESEVIPK